MKLARIWFAAIGACAALMMGLADLAAAQAPAGKIVIHWNRTAGDYDGWGLHSWESFQKKEEAGNPDAKKDGADRQITGVSWMAPLKPASKDDFGVVFIVPEDEYTNGRVNYIIHKGDFKNCAKDLFFLTSDAKEIWVNQGSCEYFRSKDDALTARK